MRLIVKIFATSAPANRLTVKGSSPPLIKISQENSRAEHVEYSRHTWGRHAGGTLHKHSLLCECDELKSYIFTYFYPSVGGLTQKNAAFCSTLAVMSRVLTSVPPSLQVPPDVQEHTMPTTHRVQHGRASANSNRRHARARSEDLQTRHAIERENGHS